MKLLKATFLICLLLTICFCSKNESNYKKSAYASEKIKILIDTDANNELDDQHALAYAFMNSDVFDVVGITVNNTQNGDGIQGQYDEAMRIITLFNLQDKMPLKKGAVGNYSEIKPTIGQPGFDGHDAVDFIISEAKKVKGEKLVLLPVGKLTNIALALQKAPEIKDKVRVVWLGSNYPDTGEYNLENDTSAVNPVIESGVDYEMVLVRWGGLTGTAAVTVTLDEIRQKAAGKGPKALTPVAGRHGGQFVCFGDYSLNLFENAGLGHGKERALFDMAAVAIVKNPAWAEKREIPAPRLINGEWHTDKESPSKIVYWENFKRDSIISDFFRVMNDSTSR